MSYVKGLRCRECGAESPVAPLHVCETCFGPLEVVYDYDAIRRVFTRELIEKRPRNIWRYRELLPIDGEPRIGLHSGCTPLVRADRLAAALGVQELWVKDDSVNHPTFSYKDRVVSVAISKAIEFGFDTVSCASTGNLANSVSAHAARAGLNCYIFIPDDLEQGKVIGSTIYGPRAIAVRGNYDDVNRLCSEVADKYGWAFVNINVRPYYTEGAKTYGFEIAEQLGWKLPKHIVVPTAGGTILPKVAKAFHELRDLGLVDGDFKIYSAQAAGCAPVVTAIHKHTDLITPVKPDTIAKSIAIGNPADGFYVLKAVRESGGWGEAATDRDPAARPHRGHLHRARRGHDRRRHQEADRAGAHPARRVDRDQRHGQRLQDARSRGKHRRAAVPHPGPARRLRRALRAHQPDPRGERGVTRAGLPATDRQEDRDPWHK
jgi:threonine synthase